MTADLGQHPNTEWAERISEIQTAHAQRSRDLQRRNNNAFKVVRRGINGVKHSKTSVVPEVQTSRAQESSVTLEEIESVEGFVNKLEKIDLPNQLVAVLNDPLLQKLLQLKRSDMISDRIDHWLMAFFDDQLADPSSSVNETLDILHAIRNYARFTKVCASIRDSLWTS